MAKKKGDCLLLGTRALQLHRQLVTDNSSDPQRQPVFRLHRQLF